MHQIDTTEIVFDSNFRKAKLSLSNSTSVKKQYTLLTPHQKTYSQIVTFFL